MKFNYKNWLYLIPIPLLIILPLLFFGKASLGLSVIVSGDFSGSDLLDLHYPFKVAIHQSLASLSIPLWNSYLDAGYPLLAEGQMAFFYPVNILFAFFPPYLGLNYSIITALVLAGVGTYLFARRQGLSWFPALLSGLSFSFSSFFVVRLKHLNLIAVASLFPFGLYFIQLFWQKTKIIYLCFFGFILGFQILAGHPQMSFYCLIVYLWFFFYQLLTAENKQPVGKAIFGLFLAGFIALGISAIQILPTIEMTFLSNRPGYVFEQLVMYPFNPKNLITFFSPYYFGNPALGTYSQDIRQMGIFWENASYLGLLPLFLALFFIYFFFRDYKNQTAKTKKKVIFLLITAVVSLFMMMGRFTPAFYWLVKSVPLSGLFRFPTRFNLFLIFSLAILSGFGIQKVLGIIKDQKKGKRFRWPLSVERTKILIFAVVLLDLFTVGKDYVGFIKTNDWLAQPLSVEYLQKDQSLFRIYSVSQYSESPYQLLGWKNDLSPHLAIKEAIPPNQNITWGLGTISDRSWFEGGLPVLRHYILENWILNDIQNEYVLGRILGMFNVKYLLNYSLSENSEMELKQEYNLGKQFGINLYLYENRQFMQRAYFVPEAVVITSQKEILDKLKSADFFPLRTVILEEKPPVIPETLIAPLDEFQQKNQLIVSDYQDLKVTIKAKLENKGFLVLSDNPYPGWKVTVDGIEEKIYTANFYQRAVYLDPGEHEVIFYYDPLWFKIGAGITGTIIIVLIIIGVVYIYKRVNRK